MSGGLLLSGRDLIDARYLARLEAIEVVEHPLGAREAAEGDR
jgi:hypothetical protein